MALPDVLNDPCVPMPLCVVLPSPSDASPRCLRSAVQSWLSSLAAGAPADALAGAEAALAAAADRGALAEAELRGLLPAELAAALPPLPPAREPPAPEGRPVNPAVTFSPGPPRTMPVARFQGGLAANRVGSELERLAQEVAAVRDALGAARAGGALRAVAARDARAALASHLRQLASGTGSEAEAWAAEPAAAAALADAQALSDELAKLTL